MHMNFRKITDCTKTSQEAFVLTDDDDLNWGTTMGSEYQLLKDLKYTSNVNLCFQVNFLKR